MLRSEIDRGTATLLTAFQETGLSMAVESVLRREKRVDAEPILAAFSRYMQLYQAFGNVERSILSILGLDMLHNMKFWAFLLTAEDPRAHPEAIEAYQRLQFAQEHLPKFLALLRRDTDDKVLRKEERKKEKAPHAILTTILIEDNRRSSPARLVSLFESIDGLYTACATLSGEKGGDLAVVSCDSGSDKSFDFLGAAKVVECVKDVILSFWNKIVYFREDKTGKHLEIIANSLPILERISELREKGTIEPERAELLKRQVVGSITKFASAGVTIPEIAEYTVFNPRQLMKPEPKLLVASTAETSPTSADKEAQTEAVDLEDPDFRKYMKEMAVQFMKDKRTTKKGKARKAIGEAPEANDEAQQGGGHVR